MKHIFAQKFVSTGVIWTCSCWSGLSCSAGWRSSRWTHSPWIPDKAEMPHDKGLFWGRCAGKQAGFLLYLLIFCQLICLADRLMRKECWLAELGMLSCLEARGFLKPSTFRWTTKRVFSEPLHHKSWCLWVCPISGASSNSTSPPHCSNCFSSTFHICCHPRALALDGSAMSKTRAKLFFLN